MKIKNHPRSETIVELTAAGWELHRHSPSEWELVAPGRSLTLRADGTAELCVDFSLEDLGDELILEGALDMGPGDQLPLVTTKVPFWATVPDLALVHCALNASGELLR